MHYYLFRKHAWFTGAPVFTLVPVTEENTGDYIPGYDFHIYVADAGALR